jgi:hypothetical protein
MATIDEELKAAEAALAAINALYKSAPNPQITVTLRKAKLAAGPIINFRRNVSIVEARDKVVNALSHLIRALDEGPEVVPVV